jgi:hypothetical protein
MEKIKTFNNLKKILIKSFEWRNKNLSDIDSTTNPKFTFFTKFNFIIIVLGLSSSLLITKISDDLVNAILTFTSIFATLIIPVLILVYDKFSKNPNSHLDEIQKTSSAAEKRFKLHRNFTNRYIFVTLENIIISVLIIVSILFYKSFLNGLLNNSINNYCLDIKYENFNTFFYLLSINSLKTIFMILVLKFIFFIFFGIGAIGDFFISVLNE